jgi:hypothetical protein
MSRPGTSLLVFATAFFLPGCGGSPTGPSSHCRTYATGLTLNGGVGTCQFDGTTYSCRFGGDTRSWSYGSASDFIREARTPNRILARSCSYSGGGPMLISFSSHRTLYSYDGLGRLRERQRIANNYVGSCVLDTTRYDRWDGLGRPIKGEITTAGGTEPLSIDYDDASLTAEASNGELTVRDEHRNIVREVEYAGYPMKVYGVTATAEVCE